MDDRLTEYDSIRNIYRLKADCNQCENIQKLGRLEDMLEKMNEVYQQNKNTINDRFSEDWNKGFDDGMCFLLMRSEEILKEIC